MNTMLIPPGLGAGLPKVIRDANTAAWAAEEQAESQRQAMLAAERIADATPLPHLALLRAADRDAARAAEPVWIAAREARAAWIEAEGKANELRHVLHLAVRDHLAEYREHHRAALTEVAVEMSQSVALMIGTLAKFHVLRGFVDAADKWSYGSKQLMPLYAGGDPSRQGHVVDRKADQLRKRLTAFSRRPQIEFELNDLLAALNVALEREAAAAEPTPAEIAA